MTTNPRIADALIVTMTRGMSFAEWARLGLLEREWAIYRRLAPLYGRILFVTYGGPEDRAIAASFGPGMDVICNDQLLKAPAYRDSIPSRVCDLLAPATDGAPPSADRGLSAVIKTNQMEGGVVAVRIARALRARSVRTGLIARGGYLWSRFQAYEHGPDSPQARDAAAEESELCRAADIVIGTSRAMTGDLAWRFGLSTQRVRLIPNYVVDVECAEARAEAHSTEVLYAGQINPRKRIDILIHAIAGLREELRDRTILSIIGEGPERDRLAELARALGVDVRFEGRLPHGQLLARMRRCAVFAQASELEGHPKTVIEAMASGVPVLVADSPGLGTVVEHGLTGLRLPPKPEAFTRAIEMLLEDAELRSSLGSAASLAVRERMSLDPVARLEIEAHRDAIAGAGAHVSSAPAGHVRFEPELLTEDTPSQVAAWERTLQGFARRLEPKRRARFLLGLDDPLYRAQGEAAVAAEGGLHPKHRLMRYHDFFVSRIRPGERAIDLGCGVGALALSIAQRSGAHVVGMDLSPQVLDKARTRIAAAGLERSVTLVLGDITRDRASGRYDTVVLSNVLEHLNNRPTLLRQFVAWYAPRRVLIRVPAFDREWRVPYKRELGVEWRLDPTHCTEYTREQLLVELSEGGLVPREVFPIWGEYWVAAEPAPARF